MNLILHPVTLTAQVQVAVEPEPVRRSHRLQYAIDGLSEQSHDYALFSASLNKAMKAYALFSSPQRAEGLSDLASFEEVRCLPLIRIR